MNYYKEQCLNKKEKKLKALEQKAIKEKAKFIMEYSDELLKKIKSGDENFIKNLIIFLMSDIEKDFTMNFKTNEYSYYNSLSVIFEICFALPKLGFNNTEQENIRNKIRLYTKHFKNDYDDSKDRDVCKNVAIDQLAYRYAIEMSEKTTQIG